MNNPKSKKFATITEEEINNFRSTARKFPEEMKHADNVLYLYQNLASNLNTYPRELVPILQMYWTCLRGYLISSQLIFQAHIPEAAAIVSRSAEAVASARKMSINPEKIEEWIKAEKNSSQPFRRILGVLFPEKDILVYPEIFNIYELMSEYGRHPSFKSSIFFSGFGKMNTENKIDFTYTDFEDELNLRRFINYHIQAYLKFLSVYRVIFKKYVSKEWVKEYDHVIAEYDIYREKLREYFKE